MIDLPTYHKSHPPSPQALDDDDLGVDLMLDDPPEGDFILLLPAKIKAFGFHNNTWGECHFSSRNTS